jgi:hypothetical protein
MGYFSNGTEGMMYEEEFCNRCTHNDEERGCAVWNAHFIYNYDQFKNEALKGVLDILIPRVPHTFGDGITHEINGECQMFNPKVQP